MRKFEEERNRRETLREAGKSGNRGEQHLQSHSDGPQTGVRRRDCPSWMAATSLRLIPYVLFLPFPLLPRASYIRRRSLEYQCVWLSGAN